MTVLQLITVSTVLCLASAAMLLIFRHYRQKKFDSAAKTPSESTVNRIRIQKQLLAQNGQLQFENDWLRIAAEDNDSTITKALELLQQKAPTLHAWAFTSHGNIVASISSESENLRLRLRPFVFELLADAADSHVILKPQYWMTDSLHFPYEELHAFACRSQKLSCGYLVLSEIPEIGESSEESVQILSTLCRSLTVKDPTQRFTSSLDSEEISLVRDMLELRTLTDMDFSSPVELLQAFLARLAALTGYERASFYSTEKEDQHRIQHLSSGGMSTTRDEDQNWAKTEFAIVETHSQPSKTILKDDDLKVLNHGDLCLKSAYLVSTFHHDKRTAWMLLSARHPVRMHPQDHELVCWAGQFLMEVLEKAVMRAEMEQRAQRDALTQLANRHTFDSEYYRLTQRYYPVGTGLGLLMLDVDQFKNINDTYGHQAGDSVLREFAEVISGTVTSSPWATNPVVARYGGEEFAVLIPRCSRTGLLNIAEAIRQAISEHPVQHEDHLIRTTISIGVACCFGKSCHPHHLMKAADQALYAAKREGRNRVVVADDLYSAVQAPESSGSATETILF